MCIRDRHDRQRGGRHRRRDAQLREGAGQPLHMAPLIDDAAAPDLADLVDTVGELIAAILDVHRSAVSYTHLDVYKRQIHDMVAVDHLAQKERQHNSAHRPVDRQLGQ